MILLELWRAENATSAW